MLIIAPFLKAPNTTMISAAKLAKPGRPMDANTPSPKANAANGIALASPPIASKSSEGTRWRISPVMPKRRAMESPWANIKTAAPVAPRMLALAMPRKI